MSRLRLRTRFLLSMLLISAGLTTTSLLVVQRSVRANVREDILGDLHNSVTTFENFEREREVMLGQSAALLADLPDVRSVMTTHDQPTIQDMSSEVWQVAPSDLLALADRKGTVVALHTKTPGFTREVAEQHFRKALEVEDSSATHWWFGAHHLYQIAIRPIYFGSESEGQLLGFVIVGDEVDERLALQVSKIAASQVSFSYGSEVVATTLMPSQAGAANWPELLNGQWSGEPRDIRVGDEHFLATSLALSGTEQPAVRLNVLKSYDQATKFLDHLNRLLLLLGFTAVLGGSALVYLISHTFTRPLANLVAGVRALGRGDFSHPLDSRGGDEVAEVTRAFDRMRDNILKTQRALLESEQQATIGRMASSISHDLRHALAAIVANAEFLCDSHLTPAQREDLYQEVRLGVNRMTDLIDSLLEFARTREALHPVYGSLCEIAERAAQAMRSDPRHHGIFIPVHCLGACAGWFDPKKLERALYNLLLNACDAAPAGSGTVEVMVRESGDTAVIEVCDNGPGIPEPIRDKLFQPFVSYGKENGTGLGLAVVQRIVQDHGGEVSVERSPDQKTVFRVLLPLRADSTAKSAEEPAGGPSLVPAKREGEGDSSIARSAS